MAISNSYFEPDGENSVELLSESSLLSPLEQDIQSFDVNGTGLGYRKTDLFGVVTPQITTNNNSSVTLNYKPTVIRTQPQEFADPPERQWGAEYFLGHSATDMVAYINPIPTLGITSPFKLGDLSTITVSTHRDKFPVSTLSRIAPKGFCYGHRTVAGTLVFSTIYKEAFYQLINQAKENWWNSEFIMADELPLFDISITAVNEFGGASYTVLQDVTILDIGKVYNIESVILSENYSYMARNLIPFQPLNQKAKNNSVEKPNGQHYLALRTQAKGPTDWNNANNNIWDNEHIVVLPPGEL